MNKEQIRHMVDRFLGYKLPIDFRPDGGVEFTSTKTFATREEAYEKNWWPIGTNLLTAQQAEEMIRFMIIDLPSTSSEQTKVESFREGYHQALLDFQSGTIRDIPPPINQSELDTLTNKQNV